MPTGLQGYAFLRHLQSLLFSGLVRWLLPLELKDTQAGLKGFSAGVIEQLIPRVRCHGFEFDCELLTGCVRLGIPITEMPVLVRYDNNSSTTSWKTSLRMIRGLWRIRQNWKMVAPQPAAPQPETPPEENWRAAA
jgi:hypothetical protein